MFEPLTKPNESINTLYPTKINQFICKITSIKLFNIETPFRLEVYDNQKFSSVLSITLDAVDAMTFAKINLANFSVEEKRMILSSLQLGLKQYSGAKCLFLVNKDDVDIVKEFVGIDINPSYPLDDPTAAWFRKLLYFSKSQHAMAKQKFDADFTEDKLNKFKNNFTILVNTNEDNRKLFTKQAQQLSDLLIQHTGWAKNQPVKRTYLPEAMRHRTNNPNVGVFVVYSGNDLNTPIAFARLHKFENLYYFGDFVVHTDYRGHGLGKYLLKSILDAIPPDSIITLIAGGAEHARKLYEEIGFERVTDYYEQYHQGVYTDDNYVLMTGKVNIGQQLINYLAQFPEESYLSEQNNNALVTTSTPSLPIHRQ